MMVVMDEQWHLVSLLEHEVLLVMVENNNDELVLMKAIEYDDESNH
jgi:hypothetical protein